MVVNKFIEPGILIIEGIYVGAPSSHWCARILLNPCEFLFDSHEAKHEYTAMVPQSRESGSFLTPK